MDFDRVLSAVRRRARAHGTDACYSGRTTAEPPRGGCLAATASVPSNTCAYRARGRGTSCSRWPGRRPWSPKGSIAGPDQQPSRFRWRCSHACPWPGAARRRSRIVGAGTAVFLVAVIMIVASDHIARNTGLRLGVALGALVLGDAVRSRRELREARREQDLRISHEREQESRRRVTDERLRIARDLHDAVAHALVAINVRAGVAAHLHPSEDSDGALTDIRTVSAEALNDLRATLSLLREADDPAPTAPTLDLASTTQLLDHAKAAGLDVDVDVELNGHTIPIAVEQAGFRIVQESLTNVMRHAAASCARIRLRVEENVLLIDVNDDGTGGASGAPGHGLRGMSERAAALGGEVSAGPGERGGWQVHARLPLTHGKR